MELKDTSLKINWQKADALNKDAWMKCLPCLDTFFALLIFTLFETYFFVYIMPILYESLELFNWMDLFDNDDDFFDDD